MTGIVNRFVPPGIGHAVRVDTIKGRIVTRCARCGCRPPSVMWRLACPAEPLR